MPGCRWGSRSTSARTPGFLPVGQLVDVDAEPRPVLLGPALSAGDPPPRVLILHEMGHVIGLEHDGDDTANVTVVHNPLYGGMMMRNLTARDVERAVYLYGAP